jgi:hypothetical protein
MNQSDKINPTSNTASSSSGTAVSLSDAEQALFKNILGSMSELVLLHNWTFAQIIERLGVVSNPQVTTQTSSISQPSNKKAGKKKKTTGNPPTNRQDGSQGPSGKAFNNVNTNKNQQGKRKQSQPEGTNKRPKPNDYKAPEDRVIYLAQKRLKERFSLEPFAPVRNGLRDELGEISERPKGGPLGFLEYVVESYGNPNGKKALLNLFSDSKGIFAVAHVLVRTVGSIDSSVVAHTLRFLSETEVGDILSGSLELGLQLLKTKLDWDPSDQELQRRLKNFDPTKVFELSKASHADYIRRQSDEEERRRTNRKTSSQGDTSVMDVDL